jgi:DNA-binding response OmpR family regulator
MIDGDSGFLLVLAKRLERCNWQHQMLACAAQTPTKVAALDIDVLTIDLASLASRGWPWLVRLCEAEPSFGIVVCTDGGSTVAERVRALRLGVDDWLSKPCHPEELIARVESVAGCRRQVEPRSLEPVVVGEVEVRPDQFQAFVDGRSLKLTRREFQLIELLCDADGEILERELIYERLWGYEMARNDRSVDVFVHKLRRKFELASPDWDYIHTEFRVGYCLAPSPKPAEAPPVELVPQREPAIALAA